MSTKDKTTSGYDGNEVIIMETRWWPATFDGKNEMGEWYTFIHNGSTTLIPLEEVEARVHHSDKEITIYSTTWTEE